MHRRNSGILCRVMLIGTLTQFQGCIDEFVLVATSGLATTLATTAVQTFSDVVVDPIVDEIIPPDEPEG